MLIVQDINVFLSWTPPFTLDIVAEHPDISGYCVDVVDTVAATMLHSECGISVSNYSYPIPPLSGCMTFIFTIIPVNIAGNGTAVSVMYFTATKGKFFILSVKIIIQQFLCIGPELSSYIVNDAGSISLMMVKKVIVTH